MFLYLYKLFNVIPKILGKWFVFKAQICEIVQLFPISIDKLECNILKKRPSFTLKYNLSIFYNIISVLLINCIVSTIYNASKKPTLVHYDVCTVQISIVLFVLSIGSSFIFIFRFYLCRQIYFI